MDLLLTRKQFLACGVFSDLTDEGGCLIAKTLEHAYPLGVGPDYFPKIPNGVFVCKRGMHRLTGMTFSFETFEITNIPGHTNILFHIGNFNRDSEGCVLLGEAVEPSGPNVFIITNSRIAFVKFMRLQTPVDSFTLTVTTDQALTQALVLA